MRKKNEKVIGVNQRSIDHTCCPGIEGPLRRFQRCFVSKHLSTRKYNMCPSKCTGTIHTLTNELQVSTTYFLIIFILIKLSNHLLNFFIIKKNIIKKKPLKKGSKF